ncbi:hypothetical protein M8J75_008048 [Diaphorina citri]|nr:hypothetical protein M8J75_008048 [Diaphorina citri]KAI5731856.1 hypothetical protein M8J77_017333 [Diaphorina citri]
MHVISSSFVLLVHTTSGVILEAKAFVVLCTLAVAAHAATTPTPEKESVTPRNVRQLYPAGYQPLPGYAPQKAAYNPYFPQAAPAPAYPAYYPAPAYPGFPSPYYPLREESSGAEESSYWSYIPSFSNIGSYFSNYPSYYPSWFGTSESESSSAASTGNSPATSSEAEENNAALLKSGLAKPQPAQPYSAIKAPIDNRFRYQPAQPIQPQFIVAGQPQFYGHYSAFQGQQDPSKLTAANNGAISSYLFLRNQPQLPVFQNNQQKFAVPATFQNGNVKEAHQQFVQYSKELQGEPSKQVEKQAAPSENHNVVVDSPAADPAPQQAEEQKNESSNGSTVNSPVAQAKPKGLAVAGEGGVADSSPSGTALVGKKGMALAAPSSIAIAGPDTPLTLTIDTGSQHKTKKANKEKKPIARFSETRGYHIDDARNE